MRELKQNWRDIFKGVSTALNVWQIMMAFVGLALFCVGYFVITIFTRTLNMPWLLAIIVPGLIFLLALVLFLKSASGITGKKALLLVIILVLLGAVGCLFGIPPRMRVLLEPISALLWFLVVGAFFGGAITRSAIVRFATHDTLDAKKLLKFTKEKFMSNLGAPLTVFLFVWFLGLCIMLGHLLVQIPYYVGPVLAVLIIPLIVIAIIMIALAIIGGIFGFPMMYPTIAAEKGDGFEALSQSYGFVYFHTLKYILYFLLSAVILLLACWFVFFFTGLMLDQLNQFSVLAGGQTAQEIIAYSSTKANILLAPVKTAYMETGNIIAQFDFTGFVSGAWRLSADKLAVVREYPGMGENLPLYHKITAWMYTVAIWVIYGLALSFLISLASSLASIVYLLMRKESEGTDVTQVYLEEEEKETIEDIEKQYTETEIEETAETESAEETPAQEKKTAKDKTSKKEAKQELASKETPEETTDKPADKETDTGDEGSTEEAEDTKGESKSKKKSGDKGKKSKDSDE